LTNEELDQLTLFSTVALSIDMSASHSQSHSATNQTCKGRKNHLQNWANVDVDSLISLCEVLEEHVKIATTVNLIQEARQVFENHQDVNVNHSSPSSSVAISKVSQ
jgi:hypothetical protein